MHLFERLVYQNHARLVELFVCADEIVDGDGAIILRLGHVGFWSQQLLMEGGQFFDEFVDAVAEGEQLGFGFDGGSLLGKDGQGLHDECAINGADFFGEVVGIFADLL